MNLPPPPGYYEEQGGRMVHHPGFGEATRDYPGLPKLRVFVIAVAVATVVATILMFFPRSPSPDEWATQLARSVAVDGATYQGEPGWEEAWSRIRAAIAAWEKESGCRLAGGAGLRAPDRAGVRAQVDRALAEARAGLPEGDFGVGSAIAVRGSGSDSDFGGAVIVADCTKEEVPPMGPFGR